MNYISYKAVSPGDVRAFFPRRLRMARVFDLKSFALRGMFKSKDEEGLVDADSTVQSLISNPL
jgi:hypothetical protein